MLSKTVLRACGKGKSLFSNLSIQNGQRLMSSYVQPHKRVRDSHMNDIPLPEPFEQVYAKRQTGNNFVLLAGVLFFAISSGFVLNSGVIVPNLTPPRKNPE